MHNKIIHCLFATFSLLLTAACTQEGQPEVTGESLIVSRARVDASIDRWGTSGTKSEGTASWVDGSVIFVQLFNGSKYLPLKIQLQNGEWEVRQIGYNGGGVWSIFNADLADFSTGNCRCFYFEGDNGENGQYFDFAMNGKITMLDLRAAPYYDGEALFNVKDGELHLSAFLKPITGRIRIERPESDNYNYYYPEIYGLLHYTALDPVTYELESSTQCCSYYFDDSTVSYIYGSFADQERRTLTVREGKWVDSPFYERSFSEDILAPGCSNRVDMPLDDRHNEWYKHDNVLDSWASGLTDLRMRYVVPGSFQMGGDDASPVHTVVLTSGFYLAENELTRNVWYQVMGEPSEYVNSSLPVSGKSWDEVQVFIEKLNAKTGYSFRLPTEAEWEYAARGGQKGNGYKYSGSENSSDVAVHDWNWTLQTIRTKNSNELGFYDMSGNAAEWVNDWYADYPTETVVDPKGPDSGDIHVRRGGNRGQEDRYLTVTFRDTDSDVSLTGFRLALDAIKIQ